MRILMVTPRFPYPPDRGDTVRSWTVLRGLARRHDVWLACVDTREPAADHRALVQNLCRDVAVFVRSSRRALLRGVAGTLAGHSLTAGYFTDRRLVRTLHDWSENVGFDGLFTFSSSIAPAVRDVAARRRVLDLCDVDSAKWAVYARRSVTPLRWLYRAEARRVARLERRAARDCDVCLLANEREQRKFLERVPSVRAGVMPTAVDLDAWGDRATAPSVPVEPVVGTIGSMFYRPNILAVRWFARHVWPRVRAAVPAARWLIVGSRPPRAVRRLGRLPNVTVTGYVPDIRPYLASMRVVVNAVDNDIGVQSKLVVALAAGKPAVVTPRAAAGLTYEDPPPLVVASSPTGFADAVIRLLRDAAHARALAARARAVAERYYSAEQAVRCAGHWLGDDGRAMRPPAMAADAATPAARLVPIGGRA